MRTHSRTQTRKELYMVYFGDPLLSGCHRDDVPEWEPEADSPVVARMVLDARLGLRKLHLIGYKCSAKWKHKDLLEVPAGVLFAVGPDHRCAHCSAKVKEMIDRDEL